MTKNKMKLDEIIIEEDIPFQIDMEGSPEQPENKPKRGRGRPPKKPVNEKISDALGMAKEQIKKGEEKGLVKVDTTTEITAPTKRKRRMDVDVEDDYNFAAANLRDLLKEGKKILKGIKNLAEESESPRNYEVAGNLVKILIEGSVSLMELHEKAKELEDPDPEKENPVNLNGAKIQVNNDNRTIHATTMEVLEAFEQQKKLESKNGQ